MEEHFKPLKEPQSEKGRALSLQELQKLEATAGSNPAWEVDYHCEVLAANSGMRGGEIKHLQIRDIDLEVCRLQIRRAKTDASVRMVELNQPAMEAIAKLFERAQLLGACKPNHYLLPADRSRHTKQGDPLKGVGFDVNHHQTGIASRLGRLDAAIGALQGSDSSNGSGTIRLASRNPRRTLSAAGRRAISLAQKGVALAFASQ